jgi:hypothetical protein
MMPTLRRLFLSIAAIPMLIVFDALLELLGFRRVQKTVLPAAKWIAKVRWRQRQAERAADDVARAVDRAHRFYWRTKKDCLPRAMTVFVLLSLCGLSPTFIIGIKQFPFGAHSWVEWNGRPVQESIDKIRPFKPIWQMV